MKMAAMNEKAQTIQEIYEAKKEAEQEIAAVLRKLKSKMPDHVYVENNIRHLINMSGPQVIIDIFIS